MSTTQQTNTMKHRTFLASASGLTFSLALGGASMNGKDALAADNAFKLNAWIAISTDNSIS